MRLLLLSLLLLATVATAQFDNPAFVGKLNRASSTPSTLTDGLLVYYRLDGNVNDSSGAGLNGTAVNTPEWNAGGIVDSCFATNATPNGYLQCNTNGMIRTTFSVSMWLKRTGAAGNNGIAGQWGTTTKTWQLTDNSSGSCVFNVTTNGTDNAITNTFTMTSDQWYHVVATFEDNTVIFYVNGSQNAANTLPSAVILPTGFTVLLGRRSSSASYFRGFIDEYGYWDRALTASEVTELYAGGSPTHLK